MERRVSIEELVIFVSDAREFDWMRGTSMRLVDAHTED